MLVFALQGSDDLGRRIARLGGFRLGRHEERDFDRGEHKARPLDPVRGRDVYVLLGTEGGPDGSANDRLLRLLFFAAACRDHGAARVTAIAPYLAYARKDRRTKAQDPVGARYVAQLAEAMAIDRFVTLDVHNPAAFQNAFRIPTFHLSLRGAFAREILRHAGAAPLVVGSPDTGGMKRAQLLREAVLRQQAATVGPPREVGLALAEKRRSGGVVSGDLFAGHVEGADVCLVDDMICSGETMIRAARAARAHGAATVHGLATHALLGAEALNALLAPGHFDSLSLGDSTLPAPLAPWPADPRLRRVSSAPLIWACIRRLSGRNA